MSRQPVPGAATRLWAHDNDFGSGNLLSAALGQFGLAQRLLDHADYDTTTGTALAAVTAELGLVAGWFAYDRGDQSTAAREGVAHAAVGDHRERERALTTAWRQVDRRLYDRP